MSVELIVIDAIATGIALNNRVLMSPQSEFLRNKHSYVASLAPDIHHIHVDNHPSCRLGSRSK